MINRELKDITVKIYNAEKDEYGQKRQKGYTTRTIKGVVKLTNQMNIDNPKYVDIDLLVLTTDGDLSDKDTLEIDSKN